jgi:hypothetical protein
MMNMFDFANKFWHLFTRFNFIQTTFAPLRDLTIFIIKEKTI